MFYILKEELKIKTIFHIMHIRAYKCFRLLGYSGTEEIPVYLSLAGIASCLLLLMCIVIKPAIIALWSGGSMSGYVTWEGARGGVVSARIGTLIYGASAAMMLAIFTLILCFHAWRSDPNETVK